MILVHTLLEANRQIIQFVYGLSFFALGLGIALQSWRYSQLELARSLPWLAAFGFIHGFNEWGDLFIPLQRAYMAAPAISFLHVLQLFLLAVSFVFLFEFGVLLFGPQKRAHLFRAVPAILLLAWTVCILLLAFSLAPDAATWGREANALARYFIGFPAGMLAAYGLRRYTQEHIAPLDAPHVVRMLRISGIALALYAIFSGLIPPPVPFFPGSWLNSATFEDVVDLPPMMFRSAIGIVLAVGIIRAREIFQLETERFIESIQQQQILGTERERIARDLHDGVIQKVYTAGLLIESIYTQAAPDSLAHGRLGKALAALDDAIADLRRNLKELQAVPAGRPLHSALRALEQDPRFGAMLDLSLEVDLPTDDCLEPNRADQVMAIVNEGLSNVVRHAHARHVKIEARQQDAKLLLVIQDDGVGLPKEVRKGYGLRNMRDRARMLGGEIQFSSGAGKGTSIRLEIPWKDVP